MGVPVFGYLAKKIFGTRNQRMVRRYLRIVNAVNRLEAETRLLTDAQLREKTDAFRQRVRNGEKAYGMIPEVFAVAREAMDRSVGIRNIFDPALHFDPAILTPEAQELYRTTKAAMDAAPPEEPVESLRGCRAPLAGWQTLDIPPALYEAVRQALPESRPPFRARPFDVQVIGGIVLSEGRIAEMKTGEGKTIVAPLATYLACIEGKQVHVVTVNDYLVQRDRDWTFPFFRALGLAVGAIHPFHMQGPAEKRVAYSCDVVYGTTSEFGFDYLRDNMKVRAEEQLQKHRDFAIVDEVDSILIDEARTPLIISGPAHQVKPRYDLADRLARHLVQKQSEWNAADETVQACRKEAAGIEGDIRNVRDRAQVPALRARLDEARKKLPQLEHARDKHTQYYEVELDKRRATVTHEGIEEAQRVAAVGSFYVGENMDLPHLLEQSIRAHTVYQRDRDYVIAPDEDGQMGVVIVDQNTGRKMVGRQWSDGLHQAVEAKEAVRVKEETQTMATVTIQNFFKLYGRLAGMTGTADTEATEFHEIYRLDVVSIPTNVQVIRQDRQDLVYLGQKDKWEAVVEEIGHMHDAGRPVLVGTTSVEKSEHLSRLLSSGPGIPHEVLNAKQHEREADIVAGAGRLGAVMVATNMAGRGTDIKLTRFTAAELLEHWKKRGIAPREADAAQGEEECMARIWRHLAQTVAKRPKADAQAMDPAAARLACMRAWVASVRGLPEADAAKMDAKACERELDTGGGFLLHRLRLFTGTEDMGGLHIVGTERHESRRIDNQLRGRSGRQGDDGSSRFFLALDDDLMRLFAGRKTLALISRFGMREGDVMENPMLSRAIEKAQRKVEERNFQIRKNILDYDEPMEHQRRSFYGMRQPVVEGRDIPKTVFEFIDESVRDGADTYLSPKHGPNCISQWVWERFGVMIDAERFLGVDAEEIGERVVVDAIEEATTQIHTTLGEYMPDGAEPEDWDVAGLREWAKTAWGATLEEETVRKGGRDAALAVIDSAMAEKFRAIDIAPVLPMLDKDFGAKAFVQWAATKFGITVDVATLDGIESPDQGAERVLEAARGAYRQRELTYPIEFALDFTTANLQVNPAAAINQFCSWARIRYELEWTPETLPSRDPRELRRLLLDAAQAAGPEALAARAGRILGEAGSDPAAVETWLAEKLFVRITPAERESLGTDPAGFLARRLGDLQRTELSHFERWVLLQVYDQAWKDHLHAMDQQRDAISFRYFSQKDPRIEFKKEAARLFQEMHVAIRDKVTDLVYKGRLQPQVMRPPQAPPTPAPASAPQGAAPAAPQGSEPTEAGSPIPSQAPPTATQERDLAIAERAVGAEASAPRREPITAGAVRRLSIPKPAAGAVAAVGRNEPCPCGSGKKYKQCHGAKGA